MPLNYNGCINRITQFEYETFEDLSGNLLKKINPDSEKNIISVFTDNMIDSIFYMRNCKSLTDYNIFQIEDYKWGLLNKRIIFNNGIKDTFTVTNYLRYSILENSLFFKNDSVLIVLVTNFGVIQLLKNMNMEIFIMF